MYAISKKLLFHWINIVQVIQTSQEFTICVEEKDLEDTVFAISSI